MLSDSIPHKEAGAHYEGADLSLDLVIDGDGAALAAPDTAPDAPRSPAGEDFFKRRFMAKHHSENGR